jgi:hypothetical protein
MKIDYSMKDVVSEFENGKFSAFASDLGMKPGEWPVSIETTMGNKMPFLAIHQEINDGDLQWVTYRQGNGCISLQIFND